MVEHAQSDCHRSAEKSLKKENEMPDIGCMLDDQMKQLQKKRREGLIAHLQTMKTLLRQGLPIRGHDDVDSNTRQSNEEKVSNEGLTLLLKENLYVSHDVLTEQEELIVLNARRQLLLKITTKTAAFYSIIRGESSDIPKTEQLSFSVRYCTDTYDIHEDFTGVLPRRFSDT